MWNGQVRKNTHCLTINDLTIYDRYRHRLNWREHYTLVKLCEDGDIRAACYHRTTRRLVCDQRYPFSWAKGEDEEHYMNMAWDDFFGCRATFDPSTASAPHCTDPAPAPVADAEETAKFKKLDSGAWVLVVCSKVEPAPGSRVKVSTSQGERTVTILQVLSSRKLPRSPLTRHICEV